MVMEVERCTNDPIYFANKYINIMTLDYGLQPMQLYDYQKDIIQSVQKNRYTVVTSSRQSGKTTTACAFILWYILFHEGKKVAILANKGDIAREILGRVQLAYEHLPKWLQQGVVLWNKGSFELENGSSVKASATSSSAIRGLTVNLLFIDEAAFIDNWDTFFTSVFPVITSGKTSKVVLVSTPNGLNHFYKIFHEAQHGRNEYNPISVTWKEVPGRDEKWKQTTLSGMNNDIDKFEQEFNGSFIGSSSTLISGSVLKTLVWQTPVVTTPAGFRQFYKPEKGNQYLIVADTSHGKGQDYSVATVFDITKMPYQQVAMFRSNITAPYDFASTINEISRIYFGAQILCESNDLGQQVADLLHFDFENEGILSTMNAGTKGKRISGGFGKGVERGVRTTKSVKATGCSVLKLLVEQQQLIINDDLTITELSRFSRKGTSYEAEEGAHDDIVMTLVLFAWLTNQAYFSEITNINTLARLRESTDEDIMNTISPFGFIDNGMLEEEMENDAFAKQLVGASIDRYMMRD